MLAIPRTRSSYNYSGSTTPASSYGDTTYSGNVSGSEDELVATTNTNGSSRVDVEHLEVCISNHIISWSH